MKDRCSLFAPATLARGLSILLAAGVLVGGSAWGQSNGSPSGDSTTPSARIALSSGTSGRVEADPSPDPGSLTDGAFDGTGTSTDRPAPSSVPTPAIRPETPSANDSTLPAMQADRHGERIPRMGASTTAPVPDTLHANPSDPDSILSAEESTDPTTGDVASPGSPERSVASETSNRETQTDDAELQPVPEEVATGPIPVQAASFKGVTPGETTMDEVETHWGAPKEITKQGDMIVQLFTVEPFDCVEVSYVDELVSSVVIRFHRAFPARTVAKQLELTRITPVLISSELGEVLGQAYPERGVLFAFEPSEEPDRPSMQVSQIILEPIQAESFVLRAETRLNQNNELCRHDLHQALELDPNNPRAHWLLSQTLATAGRFDEALEASAAAIEHEPSNPRYLISRAKLLGQAGRLGQGIEAARRAVALADDQPHLKARALCMVGDLLASGGEPDYAAALKAHIEAIRVGDAAAAAEQTPIRVTAKEVLIDAHLGAAHDIAWGEWKDKETSVPKWLARAARVAEDLIENEDAPSEHRFRVATRALAACVGAQGKIEPGQWTRQALTTGEQLIQNAEEPSHKAQLQWDLGMALYDALQVYQMRLDHDTALRYGEEAIKYLEQGNAEQRLSTASYLIGRLYFRLGAIHAIRDTNHRVAITWFEKALPHLNKPIPPEAFANLGRHGETFVSMGVSYWETGQREKAIELTEHGTDLMRQALEQGSLEPEAMRVPFANLASMHRQLGAEEKADEFEQLAERPGQTTIK